MAYFSNQTEQVLLLVIAGNQIDAVDTGQFLTRSPGIAADSNQQGIGISHMCHPELVAGLAVSDAGDCAGIEYIYISPVTGRYKPVPCFSKLPGQKLCLRLIKLTAQAVHGYPYSFMPLIHLTMLSLASPVQIDYQLCGYYNVRIPGGQIEVVPE